VPFLIAQTMTKRKLGGAWGRG